MPIAVYPASVSRMQGVQPQRREAALLPIGSVSKAPKGAPAIIGNTLTYFPVTGFFYDVEQPNPSGTSAVPLLSNISGFVDFFPGDANGPFVSGFSIVVPGLDHGDTTVGDTVLALAPITGRFINGALRGIAVGDPIGVQLLARSPLLAMSALRYHVRYRNITYGGVTQALSNFAFDAPTTSAGVNITSASLVRQPYLGPS